MTSASLCAAAFFTMYLIHSADSAHHCQVLGIVAWMLIALVAAFSLGHSLNSLVRAFRGDAKFQPQFEYRPGPWELPDGVLTDVVPTDSTATRVHMETEA